MEEHVYPVFIFFIHTELSMLIIQRVQLSEVRTRFLRVTKCDKLGCFSAIGGRPLVLLDPVKLVTAGVSVIAGRAAGNQEVLILP